MKAVEAVRVALDTNVLVAAMIRSHGAASRVLRAALDGKFRVLLTPWTYAEYGTVLRMPRLGFPPEDVKSLLAHLRRLGKMCTRRGKPVELEEVPDRADVPFMQLAVVGKADALVTRNNDDYPPEFTEKYGIPVLRPGRFLADFLEDDG